MTCSRRSWGWRCWPRSLAARRRAAPIRSWTRPPPAASRSSRSPASTRVSEQDLARAGRRRGRAAAAQPDAGFLRMLRLAFFGARPLAARATGPRVSCGADSRRRRGRRSPRASPRRRSPPRWPTCRIRDARPSSAPTDLPGCCSWPRNCAAGTMPDARRWAEVLAPLEAEAANRIRDWLPKLRYPIRVGEHSQTAFAFGLIRDWSVVAGDDAMRALIDERSRSYYLSDVRLPAGLRALGRGLPLALPRRGGPDAARAGARGVRRLARRASCRAFPQTGQARLARARASSPTARIRSSPTSTGST